MGASSQAKAKGERRVAPAAHEVKRADGETPLQVVKSDDLRRELIRARDSISEGYFRMAALLKKAFDTRAYSDWGYTTWKEYVEQEMDMGERKAQYLMKIHHWFVTVIKDPTVKERVEHLGWTKVKYLVGVVDEENVDYWVERAESMTAVQLEEYIRQLKTNEDGPGPEAEQLSTMTFRLYPSQAENVQEALEKAAEIAEKEDEVEAKKGHLLDLICSTFKVDHVFQEQRGEKVLKHYFKKMANMVDVNVIVTARGHGAIITGSRYLAKAAGAASPEVQAQILKAIERAQSGPQAPAKPSKPS